MVIMPLEYIWKAKSAVADVKLVRPLVTVKMASYKLQLFGVAIIWS